MSPTIMLHELHRLALESVVKCVGVCLCTCVFCRWYTKEISILPIFAFIRVYRKTTRTCYFLTYLNLLEFMSINFFIMDTESGQVYNEYCYVYVCLW